MNKIPFLVGIISFAIYRLTFYLTENTWLSILIFLLPISLLIIGLFFRKRLKYSNWFLNPVNISLERSVHSIESEISSDLLFDKLIEVIEDSQFRLLDTDKTKLMLLMGTSINFWTWGENIYIKIDPIQNGSIIHFTSVTLYGNSSWKRNDANLESFIQAFELSLTI